MRMKSLRSLAGLFGLSLALSCLNAGSWPTWPAPDVAKASAMATTSSAGATDDASLVKRLPVCIASPSWSAGELGQTVLFHYKREDRKLKVGYFVHWTTERPWGNNALSYAVVPALFIDAFYSHFL